jgi:hypothetical protein
MLTAAAICNARHFYVSSTDNIKKLPGTPQWIEDHVYPAWGYRGPVLKGGVEESDCVVCERSHQRKTKFVCGRCGPVCVHCDGHMSAREHLRQSCAVCPKDRADKTRKFRPLPGDTRTPHQLYESETGRDAEVADAPLTANTKTRVCRGTTG